MNKLFEKYSKTQFGNVQVIAGVIINILQYLEVSGIQESEVAGVIGGLLIVVGVITSWFGRWAKGDLTLGGKRK